MSTADVKRVYWGTVVAEHTPMVPRKRVITDTEQWIATEEDLDH